MTFFGTLITVCSMEQVKTFPTRATPKVLSVKQATVLRSLTNEAILKNIVNDIVPSVAFKVQSPALLNSKDYKKGVSMNYLNHHMPNSIVIAPNQKDGHGGECRNQIYLNVVFRFM